VLPPGRGSGLQEGYPLGYVYVCARLEYGVYVMGGRKEGRKGVKMEGRKGRCECRKVETEEMIDGRNEDDIAKEQIIKHNNMI
jgi:hypothetical protein